MILPAWQLLIAPGILALALWAPPHLLLYLDLLLVQLQGFWDVGGVLFDPSDVVFAAVVLSLLLRGRPMLRRTTTIPGVRLWLLLGILMSISYVLAPANREHLTDPVRALYQVYRYCWKPILYFPLAAMLLGHRERIRSTLVVLMLVGLLCAWDAIPQGYAGMRATGPFQRPNQLGAALVVTSLAPLILMISRGSRGSQAFAALGFVLIWRALLFSGSRGALASVLLGSTILFSGFLGSRGARPRAIRLAAAGAVLGFVALLVQPDLLDRPNVRRLLSISEGTDADTLQWRAQERWPYFWNKALESPWFGSQLAVAEELGGVANTPHNGYLELAVQFGFPVLALQLALAGYGIRSGLRLFLRSPDVWTQLAGIFAVAGIAALLTHNIVDSNFTEDFWLLTGMSVSLAQQTLRDDRSRRRAKPGSSVPPGRSGPASSVKRILHSPGLGFPGRLLRERLACVGRTGTATTLPGLRGSLYPGVLAVSGARRKPADARPSW